MQWKWGKEKYVDREGHDRYHRAVRISLQWEKGATEGLKGAVAGVDLCNRKKALSESSRRDHIGRRLDTGRRGKSLLVQGSAN